MKVDRFVFEVIVTLWLPASVVSFGLLLLGGVQQSQVAAFITWAKDAEFLVSFILFGALTLIGVVIAAVHGVIEECLLDRVVTPRLLKITRETFDQEWFAYLWDLPNRPNSYVSRVVLYFMLETRMALAFLFLTFPLALSSSFFCIATLISAVLFYWLGILDHRALAQYRHQHYANGKIPKLEQDPSVKTIEEEQIRRSLAVETQRPLVQKTNEFLGTELGTNREQNTPEHRRKPLNKVDLND